MVTVPLGEADPASAETVELKVTGLFWMPGLGEAVRVVAVGLAVMVSRNEVAVDGCRSLVPAKVAVTRYCPGSRPVLVYVAVPEALVVGWTVVVGAMAMVMG